MKRETFLDGSDATKIRPISRTTISDEIVAQIMNLIKRGDLKPGERLPSGRELCVRFGIGRSSLREALRCLSIVGILNARAGDGTSVAISSRNILDKVLEWRMITERHDVENLMEVRIPVEGLTAANVAKNWTTRDLCTLRSLLEKMKSALKDHRRFLTLDVKFHFALALASGNPLALDLIGMIRDQLARVLERTLSLPNARPLSLEEHAVIVNRIEARDAEGAQRAMYTHLQAALKRYQETSVDEPVPNPEYLVDVTHAGLLDFIAGCNLWPFTELNLWYHVLNCGFKLKSAAETDFPCIADKCVGGGRTYVKLGLPPVADQGYSSWLASGLQNGHSYFGDGRSHIFNFCVDRAAAGNTEDEVVCKPGSAVHVSALVCARLGPEITPADDQIRRRSPYDQPYWHLKRARIGNTRRCAVQLVVNGIAQQRFEIEADGQPHPVSFELPVHESCWIALRIYPSSHMNPITLLAENKPVRASRRSAAWCRKGVDVCWEQKSQRIRPSEIAEAKAAYQHARSVYDQILSEIPS